VETVCTDGFSFFRDMVGGFRLVRCIKRMSYSPFLPLYYVSEIRNNNVQTKVLERTKEKIFTLWRYCRNVSSWLLEDYNESALYVKSEIINLTFMGPCIANIFQYISNKMQLHTVYLYLETAVHVSGVTSTHNQKRNALYLQHLVFVTPLLLPAAIVEEMEPV